jgi:hypothetical protein
MNLRACSLKAGPGRAILQDTETAHARQRDFGFARHLSGIAQPSRCKRNRSCHLKPFSQPQRLSSQVNLHMDPEQP